MMDPMSEIENEKTQLDMGKFTYRVYQGARSDGASRFEAFWTTVAFVTGTFKANDLPREEDDE